MSIVAEFAGEIHNKFLDDNLRVIKPAHYPARTKRLQGIRAVIFDVYGTLVNYWKTDFSDKSEKKRALLTAFEKCVNYFSFSKILAEINSANEPAETLHDFFHALIALNHEKSIKKGITYPEVRIEEIWLVIIMILEQHGYLTKDLQLGDDKREIAKCMAYFYHFHSLGRGFYDGVISTLQDLQNDNIKLGIVSNAQFYTPIDLNLFLRDNSPKKYVDYSDLFADELIVYSYELGVSKPNQALFRKLYDALYEFDILPKQTLFVGNDLVTDIKPASEAGMLTALFCGDADVLFLHDQSGKVHPDIMFDDWKKFSSMLSFNENY